MTWLATSWHYIIGLAGIGALSGLTAVGSASANVTVPIISGLAAALAGIGGTTAAVKAATPTVVTPSPAPPNPPVA